MAIRTKCLYNGKKIGIESIFTAVNGKQINKAQKVEELRDLGRKGLLFCPCGCGSNLILVAGDKNLREQHFRIKNDSESQCECRVTYEGEESLNTKIALKCWLEDKLSKKELQCEVPVNTVDDTYRKYEYTVFDPDNRIGIGYWRNRLNITDEKISVLNNYAVKVIYVVGEMNLGTDGQYPEFMIKVQKTQGFNLYISLGDKESVYESSTLTASVYAQNLDDVWEEIKVCTGLLPDYSINTDGALLFGTLLVLDIANDKLSLFQEEQSRKKLIREREVEERRRIEEEYQKKRERLRAEWEKQQEKKRLENEEKAKLLKAEAEQKNKEEQLAEERKEQDRIDFKNNIEKLLNQQTERVVDPDGNRWIKCEVCGKIGTEEMFPSYGGANHINLGRCYDCDRKKISVSKYKAQVTTDEDVVALVAKAVSKNKCPKCSEGELIVKNGRYGKFIGCSNFPKCNYSEKYKESFKSK